MSARAGLGAPLGAPPAAPPSAGAGVAVPNDGAPPRDEAARPADAPEAPPGHHRAAREVLASPEFKALVARRWAVSFALLALLFVSYYGFILLIATDRAFVARKIGDYTTLAIPLGVGVIAVAWALTAVYVAWANRAYDPEVARLKQKLLVGPEPPPGGGPTP